MVSGLSATPAAARHPSGSGRRRSTLVSSSKASRAAGDRARANPIRANDAKGADLTASGESARSNGTKAGRRDLIAKVSSLSTLVGLASSARASEDDVVAVEPIVESPDAPPPDAPPPPPPAPKVKKVYLDVEVDNEGVGRIGIALDAVDTAPAGVKRFLELATGELSCMSLPNSLITGSKFDFIDETTLRSSGPTQTRLKATTTKCDRERESAAPSSSSAPPVRSLLERELASQTRSHASSGDPVVSIEVAEDASKVSAPAGKLISKNGRLEVVEDTPREDLMPLPPSGTSYVITTVDGGEGSAPADEVQARQLRDLDRTHLIVGRVVEGRDVLRRLKSLPINTNKSDSLFFKAGKSAGDARAKVAERGFNRPFARIVVVGSGLY